MRYLVGWVVILVIALALLVTVSNRQDAKCEARGGHMVGTQFGRDRFCVDEDGKVLQ